MGRKPVNEMDALARAARAQLKRADAIGKSLDERMKIRKEASENFTLSEDDRRDFASVTQTIRDCGAALIRAREGGKKDRGGLTEEQLAAQFAAEIVLAAPSLSDEDWQRMCAARAKAGR